jgi:hypothetical protein
MNFFTSTLEEIDTIVQAENALVEEQKNKSFQSIYDQHTESNIFLSDGDSILDTVMQYLDKLYRSDIQKEMHMTFLGSCIRNIYGESYRINRHRVMQKYDLPSRRQNVLVCCPRRIGKTFAVAYFAVVICIVVPNQEISIFSPGKRQSTALMGHIYDFLKKLGEEDRLVRKNEEKMILRCIGGGQSIINAYPGKIDTLKGVSGTILILEELANIDERLVIEVVFPLIQLDVTSFIGISTIKDEHNIMAKYLGLKDDNGDNVFEVKRIFPICDKCRANNKSTKCPHNSNLMPKWFSSRKRKIVECLMRDNQEMFEREIGGITSATSKAFQNVRNMASLPRWSPHELYSTRFIFIVIDPTGGGKSDFAIASFIKNAGIMTLVGAESVPAKTPTETNQIILDHVQALERIRGLEHARKVFILEANMQFESHHIETFIKRCTDINHKHILHEKDGRVGFTTTNEVKCQAVELVRGALNEDLFNIADEKSFASVYRPYHATIEFLVNQMAAFSELVEEPKRPGGKTKRTYTGKTTGSSKDDLVMAVLLGFVWIPVFYNSSRFEYLRK